MAFVMRGRDGAPVWSAATLRDAGRHAARCCRLRPCSSRRAGRGARRAPARRYPVAVLIRVGARSFAIEPWFDDQEIDARPSTGTVYWEGAVRASEDGVVRGGGYLELTGYAAPLKF